MSQAQAAPKTYGAELRALLERGNAGDNSVLPALKKAFDDNPELVAVMGDLVRHAEDALLTLAGGRALTVKEAIRRQVGELRARLSATAASELEKVLIDRVCLSWMAAYYGDLDLANHLIEGSGAGPAAQAAQKRLDRAHNRLLAAVKALATVQTLIRPALSPLDVLNRPVAETAARERGRQSPSRIPASVFN
jgi:hypothetical protein